MHFPPIEVITISSLDQYLPIPKFYHIPVTEFISLAQFYLPIDYNFSFFNTNIGFTAGFDQVQNLEELIELDVFVSL